MKVYNTFDMAGEEMALHQSFFELNDLYKYIKKNKKLKLVVSSSDVELRDLWVPRIPVVQKKTTSKKGGKTL